ncbi:MAG TPA: hypothetical protein VFX86_03485 [Candidatus Saccharimonadales bacterium]|nr:hypothetical protein [Candidatus Saccharimonadales bacterium]
MTRQDLLAVTEVAKNKIIERLVTKYDVQVVCDNAANRILASIQSMRGDNQATTRYLNARMDQYWKKIAIIEEQTTDLADEIKEIRRTLDRIAEGLESVRSDQPADFSPLPVK